MSGSSFSPSLILDCAPVRLPVVDPQKRAAVEDRLLQAGAGLPSFEFLLPTNEAHRAADMLSRGRGALTHEDVLRLTVPIVEALLDAPAGAARSDFPAQLILLTQFPMVPELMALQIAFGRRAAEAQVLKVERLVARARHRGVTADEYIQGLAATDDLPQDRPYRLFRGETRRVPDEERIRLAVAAFREVAALAPGPLRAPLLSAIAWLQWVRGKRAVAFCYLAAAWRIDQGNVLAGGLAAYFYDHRPAWLDGG